MERVPVDDDEEDVTTIILCGMRTGDVLNSEKSNKAFQATFSPPVRLITSSQKSDFSVRSSVSSFNDRVGSQRSSSPTDDSDN